MAEESKTFDDDVQKVLDENVHKYLFGDLNDFQEYFDQHIKLYGKELLSKSGVLRFAQSVIYQVKNDDADCNLVENVSNLLFHFQQYNTSSKEILLDEFFQMIDFFVNPCLDSYSVQWDKHGNICFMMQLLFEIFGKLTSKEKTIEIVQYLARVIEESDQLKPILWAIGVLDKLDLELIHIDPKARQQIIKSLDRISTYYEQVDIIDDFLKLNSLWYQLSFSAKWTLKNVMFHHKSIEPTVVKILSDFAIRSDSEKCPVVQCCFPVLNGTYYYEVIEIGAGHTQIGWATSESKFDVYSFLGSDPYSIAFDTFYGHVRHNKHEYTVRNYEENHINDDGDTNVFGFLFDADNGKFCFYINGTLVKYQINVRISSQPYYATAILMFGSQLYFNFGQKPFKHPPKSPFNNFHESSSGNLNLYKLLKPEMEDDAFWFKRKFSDHKKQLLFNDQTQQTFDQVFITLGHELFSNEFHLIKYYFDSVQLTYDTTCSLRLIQSAIEHFRLPNEPGLAINLIFFMFAKTEIAVEKFFELLHLYIELLTTDDNAATKSKLSNILIVLLTISANIDGFEKFHYVRKEILPFTIQMLMKSNNKHTIWYCLLILKNLLLEQCESRDQLAKHYKFMLKLTKLSEFCEKYNSSTRVNEFDSVQYQIGMCAKWFLKQFNFNGTFVDPLVPLESFQIFNHEIEEISIQSSFPVTTGAYYYEVTILTEGVLLIGWSLYQRKILPRTHLVKDIFYCGSQMYSAIVINNETVKIPNEIKRWKAGDVIGCLLNIKENLALFYLNGTNIEYDMNINLSSKRYFATVVLSQYQHCCFNFGQVEFRYPPKDIQFSHFHWDSKQKANEYKLQEVDINAPSIEDILENEMGQSDDCHTFENWIDELQDAIQNGKDRLAIVKVKTDFYRLVCGTQCDPLQLVTAMIENVKHFDCIETFAELIWHYMNQFNFSFNTPPQNVYNAISIYMGKPKIEPNQNVQRNVCIALSMLLERCDELEIEIVNDIISFLTLILTQEQDQWSVLFALICLERIAMKNVCHQNIFRTETLYPILKRFAAHFQQLTVNDSVSVRYQVSFCALWCIDPPILKQKNTLKSTLDFNDKTKWLKLSPDLLSARSDWNFQSIRSTFAFSWTTFYYEVTILTGGFIKIGWATKACPLTKWLTVGDDDQSVAYEGFHQNVWHNKQKYRASEVTRWKAGDVVGCMIDLPNKQFSFYLNGAPIVFQCNVQFSSKPYFAAVTLSPHQQCCFNFGKSPFQYPPKVPFSNSYSIANTYLQQLSLQQKALCDECNVNESMLKYANKNSYICNYCLESK